MESPCRGSLARERKARLAVEFSALVRSLIAQWKEAHPEPEPVFYGLSDIFLEIAMNWGGKERAIGLMLSFAAALRDEDPERLNRVYID